MVSELSLDNIWFMVWPKKKLKNRPESQFQRFLGVFSAKIATKYYRSLILEPYLDSSRHDEPFEPPIWKKIWKFIFLLSIIFSKFNLMCANRTSSVYGRKWHCFVIHIRWYETTSENLKKVEFSEKWNALMSSQWTKYVFFLLCILTNSK